MPGLGWPTRGGMRLGWLSLRSGAFWFLDLWRQQPDLGQGPVHPVGGEVRRRAPVRGQARVPPHRAFGGAEGPRPVYGRQFLAGGVVEPDAHGRPEEPGEHVPTHERAEVAEHRLDLDRRVFGYQAQEELLVVLGRLRYLHA